MKNLLGVLLVAFGLVLVGCGEPKPDPGYPHPEPGKMPGTGVESDNAMDLDALAGEEEDTSGAEEAPAEEAAPEEAAPAEAPPAKKSK